MSGLDLERQNWAAVAKQHGWYSEPFYVMAWVNDTGEIIDSVSYIGIDRDYVLSAEETD